MVARTAGPEWSGPIRGPDFFGTKFFGPVRCPDFSVRIFLFRSVSGFFYFEKKISGPRTGLQKNPDHRPDQWKSGPENPDHGPDQEYPVRATMILTLNIVKYPLVQF